MQVRNFQHVFGDVVDPVIHANFSAGRAKAGFAGEGDAQLIVAAGTKITGIAALRVTAKHHALNDICNVGTLIEGNFFLHAKIAPEIPMLAEDLAEAVMPSWVVERPGRESLILKGR